MINDETGDNLPAKEIRTGGLPVEACFSLFSTFGTHDSETSGEALNEIELNDGRVLSCASNLNAWREIAPGVAIKSSLEYGTSSRKTSDCIRIQPAACPVILRIEEIRDYSASDYPHVGSSRRRTYTIRVVDA